MKSWDFYDCIKYKDFGDWKIKTKTSFIRRISAVSNAIQTIDNEANHLIIYCLNCIRHGRNASYEPGLTCILPCILWFLVLFAGDCDSYIIYIGLFQCNGG